MNHKPKIQPPKPKPDVLVPVTGVGIAKHKHGIQVTMHTNDGWRCYVMDEDTAFLFAKALISFLPSVSGKRERAGTEKKSA